jgi:hypothetical protein
VVGMTVRPGQCVRCRAYDGVRVVLLPNG